MNMWKQLAKQYLEYSIKYQIFSNLKGKDPRIASYVDYLDERVDTTWVELIHQIYKLNQGMLSLEDLIVAFEEAIDYNWIEKQPNGLYHAVEIARTWIDMLSWFFEPQKEE